MNPGPHHPLDVLFCTQTAHPLGGVETWLDGLVGLLTRQGVGCKVALVQSRVYHKPDRYMKAHPTFDTVVVPGRPHTSADRTATLANLFERLRPRVVVPVSLFDPLPAAARCKAGGLPMRLVVCCHSFAAPIFLDVQRFIPWIDHVVAINKLQIRVLCDGLGLPSASCGYRPHAVPAARKTRRPTGGPLRIGYVGRFEQTEKRVLDLIDICKCLRVWETPYTLRLAGDGPVRIQLERELATELREGRVRIEGWLDARTLYDSFYPQLDAFLILSPSETGPLVALEAMAHGAIPVVSDYRGRAAEGLIRDGRTGLVFPVGNTAAAAVRLRELAEDPELRERLSLAARSEMATRTDLCRHGAEWVDLFRTILRIEPKPSPQDAAMWQPKPAGRLEQWGVPLSLTRLLRRASCRRYVPADPGAEWPHHGPCTPESAAAVEEMLVRFDREVE